MLPSKEKIEEVTDGEDKDKDDQEVIITKRKLYYMIISIKNDLEDDINDLKQDFNNGIKTATKENTKAIKNMQIIINDIKNMISKRDGKAIGAEAERNRLWKYVAILGSLIGIGGTVFGIVSFFF